MINILTDSCSDLNKDLIEQYQFDVIRHSEQKIIGLRCSPIILNSQVLMD